MKRWLSALTALLMVCTLALGGPAWSLAEEMPEADAIVLLGGGMAAAPGHYPYADMAPAADRVWHAARLYKAGKAPLIIPSGSGDLASTVPLLRDFGVPQAAILVEGKARNTEENAKFVSVLLEQMSSANKPSLSSSQLLNASTPQRLNSY